MNSIGQAIIEYMIILALAISLVVILRQGLTSVARRTWLQFSCEIAAPCPTCRGVDPRLRSAANQVGAPCER